MDGTLLYREYDAELPDGGHAMVAVTLDALWGGVDDEPGVVAYGHILLLGACGREPPMAWMCDGAEIHIAASAEMAAAFRRGLREAIGSFVLQFVEAVGPEAELLSSGPPTIH